MDAGYLIETFALAQGTAKSKTRVPKARFLELPEVTAPKRKLLSDEVAEIILLAIFNEDTTHIPSHKTSEVVYEEVYFFQVALKKDTHLAELNQLLQMHITNPAIIFYTMGESVAISAAPKRLHKQGAGKTVVDSIYLTSWLSVTNIMHDEYLQAGAVTNCSFTHLERLYQNFTSFVRHAELLQFMTNVEVDRQRNWAIIDEELSKFRKIMGELRRLSEEERTHTAFGDKLSLRSRQVALEKEKSTIISNVQHLLEKKA